MGPICLQNGQAQDSYEADRARASPATQRCRSRDPSASVTVMRYDFGSLSVASRASRCTAEASGTATTFPQLSHVTTMPS